MKPRHETLGPLGFCLVGFQMELHQDGSDRKIQFQFLGGGKVFI